MKPSAGDLAGFRRPVMLTLWGRAHQQSLSFSMAMMPLAVNHAIPGVPARNDVSQELGNSEYLYPLIPRRFSLFKGAKGLPISCLSCAPTASNVEQTKANVSMAVGERAISAGPVGATPLMLDGGEWTSPV